MRLEHLLGRRRPGAIVAPCPSDYEGLTSLKNEKTLLVNLWQLLVKETRFCKKKLSSGEQECLSPAEEKEAAAWIRKSWRKDDKLWTKWDAEFFARTLPEIAKTGDDALDGLLEKVPRVKRPKPDICIGFDGEAFSQKLEAKGADGTIGEAANQCCRGGAAMAKNCRDFYYKATNAWLSVIPSQNSSSQPAQQPQPANLTVEYPRPDMRSFAFSVALSPEIAILFVHWAEETGLNPKTKQETEVWHQTKLRTYKHDSQVDIGLLRCNIDNILDWGIATRKRKIEAQCEKYLAHIVGLTTAEKTTAGKRARDALEAATIKRQKTVHEEAL
ncbi:MAG: hypothetical protein Q9196_001388 [Gyalolechia fulgens]